MKLIIASSIAGLFLSTSMVYGSAEELIKKYRNFGAGPFSAAEGKAAWIQERRSASSAEARSCTSCHGTNLKTPGRHAKTGKSIEPMALSVNPARLSDPQKVEKWFRRNCRWTIGRECSLQEKGNFVRFMTSQ